ncbi:MAG: VOC family protein [Nibricoccus sp.]
MKLPLFLCIAFFATATFITESFATHPKEKTIMSTIRTRYMVNDIDEAVSFYTKHLGFQVAPDFPINRNFAMLSRGDFALILSTPFGPGGAAKPMLDGRKAEPGGWTRIVINVDNLQSEIDRLRKANVRLRSEILTGPGGSEIILDDPSGNPVELFQPAAQ